MLNKEKMKYIRKLYKITQKELGEEMGISRNYISQIENGKLPYSEEQCKRYTEAIYLIVQKRNDKVNNEI